MISLIFDMKNLNNYAFRFNFSKLSQIIIQKFDNIQHCSSFLDKLFVSICLVLFQFGIKSYTKISQVLNHYPITRHSLPIQLHVKDHQATCRKSYFKINSQIIEKNSKGMLKHY